MKIAILTHFGTWNPGYALNVGWLERARLLQYAGQDFEFLVNETHDEGIYPNQRNCLKSIDSKLSFDRKVVAVRENYREVLAPYDVILTADLIYQSKGNFLVWNQAARHVQEDFRVNGIPKRWFHWIHSAWTQRDENAEYPTNLRFTPMADSTIVYMNEAERAGAASMYGLKPEEIAVVYNPKDPRSFFEFHELASKVVKILDIPNKRIVQIFPFCATRMDAKGINEVLQAHAAIKRAGASTALVLADANARQVDFELCRKDEYAQKLGLVENEDYFWTHKLTYGKQPLPRKAVSDLFRCANVFVFSSWREVCPNVLLEARVSGNLLVVNENLPCAREFAGDRAIYFRSMVKRPGAPDGRRDEKLQERKPTSWDELAGKIIARAPYRENLWRFSWDRIWETQLRPLLYGTNTDTNG